MSYVEGGINYGYNSSFERTYKLAQKLAFKKQEMFPEENFILRDSINALLVDVWPNVEFSKMDKVFLTDFISGFLFSLRFEIMIVFSVGNEIISEEQAEHIFDTKGDIICLF
uniref:Uncharacterized protein n=1 Tax=Panagrolaimus superbus TaxID=310955 RepID=A0A914XYM9_9BILA